MNNRIPFPPGSTVAAYFRDSGGDTQELSIPQQEQSFHNWCTQNGLIPGAIFRDAARPGSSVVTRTGFQDMMHHFRSEQAPEAGLVIWSYSRFARDFDDAQFYRADLRRRGFLFHSLNDDIPEGPMGRLFEAVIDWKNEQFLEDMSRDVKRGLADLVTRHGAVPGSPPRGFIRQPLNIGKRRDGHDHIVHRWIPNPEIAPRVRQAFDMLLTGASLTEIQAATHLYRSKNCFLTFFSNPIYKGVLKFSNLVIENYCEPVVLPEIWERAQAIIHKRAQKKHLSGDNPDHPRRTGKTYLLSGILYCALCSSPMSGSTSRGPGRIPNERYVCTRAIRNHDCEFIGIPRTFIEEFVLRTIREQILTPENLAESQEMLLHLEDQRLAEIEQKRLEIKGRLAQTRRNITNITDTLAEAGKSRALLTKLADLETYEADILSELNQLDNQAKETNQPLDQKRLTEISARLSANLDRRILRGLFKRILIERDGQTVLLQFEYFYPPEPKPPPYGILPMSLSPQPLGAFR